ncbi:MAG TPA: hypothetical protein VGX25_28195 [Actinophytocola sp.]|uniref:hypothetical protein n=1 Tax=Actinophytocola sp. TaxID=1872138 RepID=UPI002DDCBEB3|nr:hypothetical protein [Actinophytocola sp.]HEV2783283.1 hypothetical protein [Actinophytocola sp.]
MQGQAGKLRPIWLELLVVLLLVGMVIAIPYLLTMAAFSSATLFGDPPTPGQLRAASNLSLAAFLVGAAGSLVGIAATVYTGQRVLCWTFAAVLWLTLVIGACVRLRYG